MTEASPPPDIEQGERAKYTVEYAYKHSPYYRHLLDENNVAPSEIRTIDDLCELPVVTADDILENQPPASDTFRFRNDGAETRRPFRTSGTTGEPKVIFKSYDEMQQIAVDVCRGHRHLDVTPDHTVVNYLPFVGLNISCFCTERGLEKLGVETIPISNTEYPPETEADILRRQDPDVLEGLASHIDAKVTHLQEAGIDTRTLGVETVILVGEPVSDARKRRISEAFTADVYEYYGCSEAGAFAWECRDGDGLHVLEDSVYVEVVDEAGDPVPPGEPGRLLVTNLLEPGNECAMPLLRYAIGDRAVMEADRAVCDCPLSWGRRVKRVHRSGQNFVAGGVNLSPLFFEEQLYTDPTLGEEVDDYQIHLEYDAAAGQEIIRLEVDADGVSGVEAMDITRGTEASNPAVGFGQRLLDANAHLADTVENAGSVRLDVQLVDGVEMPPGKPTRLVDRRRT